MDSMQPKLIKPTQITLTSNIGGENESRTFSIGRYPALQGVKLVGRVMGLLQSGARNSDKFPDELQNVALEVCKYAYIEYGDDAKMWLGLGQQTINDNVPDVEMLLLLIKEVHEYNTNFLSVGNALKTSRHWTQNLSQQITKISKALLDSVSQKD